MSIFISYRFSDIPVDDLVNLLDPVYNLFKSNGVDIFCNFYKSLVYTEENYTVKQIMEDCFTEINKKDYVLCLVDTDKYSCGMLLEIGYALASSKKIVVCFRDGCEIDTLKQMADQVITYVNYSDLHESLITWYGL